MRHLGAHTIGVESWRREESWGICVPGCMWNWSSYTCEALTQRVGLPIAVSGTATATETMEHCAVALPSRVEGSVPCPFRLVYRASLLVIEPPQREDERRSI